MAVCPAAALQPRPYPYPTIQTDSLLVVDSHSDTNRNRDQPAHRAPGLPADGVGLHINNDCLAPLENGRIAGPRRCGATGRRTRGRTSNGVGVGIGVGAGADPVIGSEPPVRAEDEDRVTACKHLAVESSSAEILVLHWAAHDALDVQLGLAVRDSGWDGGLCEGYEVSGGGGRGGKRGEG